MRTTLSDLAEAAGGKLLRGEPGSVVDSYAIDTRKLARGGAFFALTGSQEGENTCCQLYIVIVNNNTLT